MFHFCGGRIVPSLMLIAGFPGRLLPQRSHYFKGRVKKKRELVNSTSLPVEGTTL
jgi:hypothetical protein